MYDFFFHVFQDQTGCISKMSFFAVGALKKGTPGAPFEDDLMLHLGVESIECITFFKRLQFGDAIFPFTDVQESFKKKQLHHCIFPGRVYKLWPNVWLEKLLG